MIGFIYESAPFEFENLMGRVVDGYAALGATVQEALERIADEADAARQVAQLRTTLGVEKQLSDDRWETINRKVDELNGKLDRVLRALGTNGTGGHGH